jgi:hypothetical protein
MADEPIPGLLSILVTHPRSCSTCGQPSKEWDVLRACLVSGTIWDDARYGRCTSCRRTWRDAAPLARTTR